MITSLPVEIILLLLSYLPAIRDRIALRCVSKKLRSIYETPLLWRNFEWPTYDLRDELRVSNVLKWCGEHVNQLSFPDHVTPKKMLNYCSNVTMLNIPTTKLDHNQLRSVLDHMKYLQKLDIKWNFQIWHLLNFTHDHPNLKEVTVRVYMRTLNTEAFIKSTHLWVNHWMLKGFVPSNINFVNAGLGCEYGSLVGELLRVWLKLNPNSPAGRTGVVKYFNKTWLNLHPDIPEFELEFSQSTVLPMVKISHFGILGLEIDWALVTKCFSGQETVYKAACISPAWLVEDKEFSYVNSPILNSVVNFDLSNCDHLLSGHLEQLAISCPNIQQLNVQYSESCLKSLQGLRAIATLCEKLQGLNILGITEIESQVQLWQILSYSKLTYLAIDLCVVKPLEVTDGDKLVELYQHFVTLKALEFYSTTISNYCEECETIRNNDKTLPLLSYFLYLEFCLIDDVQSSVVQDIVSSCKKLKYFRCSSVRDMLLPVHSSSLQQIHVDTEWLLPVDFLNAISAHGGLVCVVLNVYKVSIEGVTVLVENSPDLLLLHVKGIEEEQSVAALTEKFSKRKLFTRGIQSFKLFDRFDRDDEEIEHSTNLLSLCNESFLMDVRIDSLTSDNDNLSASELDDYIAEPSDRYRWQPYDGGSD